MSAANNPRPERDDDFFDEPDYDKFSDEELDALARGESLDQINSNRKKTTESTKLHSTQKIPASYPADDDLEPEEIDPELEREFRKEFDAEQFDDDDDWDEPDHDDLDEF